MSKEEEFLEEYKSLIAEVLKFALDHTLSIKEHKRWKQLQKDLERLNDEPKPQTSQDYF
jgi:hypothetical protein